MNVTWPRNGKPLKARCKVKAGHPAPATGCSCGIYALHPRPSSARTVFAVASGGQATAAGIVAVWGEVEVHEAGFRARFAHPTAFVLDNNAAPGYARRIEAVAAAHRAAVIRVASAEELLSYCRDNGLGLGEAAVAELLEPSYAIERRRRRRARIWATIAAAACVLAGAGVLWLTGPTLLDGLARLINDRPSPLARENRSLEILDQQVVEADDGSPLYFAIVRNESHAKSALGTFAIGDLLDGHGGRVGSIDTRFKIDSRANLAPRQTGVVIDSVQDTSFEVASVRRFRVKPAAGRFVTGPAEPPVLISRPRLDLRRCLLSARVTSSRRHNSVWVVVVARDRRRHITGFAQDEVGPLRRGTQSEVIERIRPHACAHPPASVEIYPDLSREQLVAPTRR
jgi:hypothetical protein